MAEQTVKINIDKFLGVDYIKMVEAVVGNIITSDDQADALDLIRIFSEALSQENVKLKMSRDYSDFYNNVLIKLKFIALPLLEDKEVISLLSNNFVQQFLIEDYKFLDKFNYKLLNTILVDDRNNLKKELLRNLLEDKEIIVNNGPIKKINDWLKNYVSNVGLEGGDKLARAQYLVTIKNNKIISAQEYYNLLILFKFYDELNIPADSPQGLIETPPVSSEGKLYIFRKGIMEPISENKELALALAALNNHGHDNGQAQESPANYVSSVSAPISAISNPASELTPLAELEQALSNYSPDSLEYKAIKQEMNRLKVAEFKQAQKTNAKK